MRRRDLDLGGDERTKGMMAIVLDRQPEAVLCERCRVAASPWSRLKGLLGRRALGSGEGLLLNPANAVHTWFMRFSIDVVFVDSKLSVVAVAPDVQPWRFAGSRRARAAIELPAGECRRRGIAVGDVLRARHA